MRKILLANIAITLVLLAVLDVAAFFILPQRYVLSFPGYRKEFRLVDPLMVSWPRWYYLADPVRGFRIGRKARSKYVVDGNLVSVWSNSIGCFDREHSDDSTFVYFAGDSFTWGHVPYEDNFGTLVETETGTPVFKCGVEHTGQRHQLDKLAEIAGHSAARPKAIFVFHFDNDVANDYAYPHSTVVDGWLVDAVATDSNHVLVRRSPAEISGGINTSIRYASAQYRRDSVSLSHPVYRLRRRIAQYSITENVVRTLLHRLAQHTPGGPSTAVQRPLPASASPASGRPGKSGQLNLYTIPAARDGKYWYLDNPYADANKKALVAFKDWSRDHDVPLVVVLIPRNDGKFDASYKTQLRSFLKSEGIRYMDLAAVFAQRKIHPGDLYWREDPHFNRAGNAATARALLDSFPQYLGRADRTSFQAAGH